MSTVHTQVHKTLLLWLLFVFIDGVVAPFPMNPVASLKNPAKAMKQAAAAAKAAAMEAAGQQEGGGEGPFKKDHMSPLQEGYHPMLGYYDQYPECARILDEWLANCPFWDDSMVLMAKNAQDMGLTVARLMETSVAIGGEKTSPAADDSTLGYVRSILSTEQD
eukprot:GILJ01004195.1.p1 GENE.GILJ01004195.1~~GILJ01004195.1.p1  ORF type:complete len:174 (+),score=27.54 GILJ01004195.1:34-522(+)